MNRQPEFHSQFLLKQDYYLTNFDFINWYRYYFIIKEALSFKPGSILEVGTGDKLVKYALKPLVSDYKVLDINPNLEPDYLGDIRVFDDALKERFHLVIAADIMEHIPFPDLGPAFANIFHYLHNNGRFLLTIPHRASHFLFMTPLSFGPRAFRVPTGFLSPGGFYRRFIKKKIWIDPNHCWEIGDGTHNIKDVNAVINNSGFKIEKFQKLVYVDFWVLKK